MCLYHELAQHRIVLVVALDRGPGVGRLHRLLEKADLASDPGDRLVERFDVVDGLADQLLVAVAP